MINFDDYTNENKTKHNANWPYIPDYSHKIIIIGSSESGKRNLLLNLVLNQHDIHKIYFYAKDPYEAKYQYLINKRESVGKNRFNDPEAILSIQTICAMFTKILMNTILIQIIKT